MSGGYSIILASASPRRRELLERSGVPFETAPADVDEASLPGEAPDAMVRRLAEAKARAIVSRYPEAWIIGADTVVVQDGRVFGKPADRADARAMLTALQGRDHVVWGGFAVLSGRDGRAISEAHATTVRFAPMAADEIERYLDTDEPMDKAGAYAIQGYGGQFVESIEGSYSNVVGLNLAALLRVLKAAGGVGR